MAKQPKKTGTALVKWEEEFANMAKETAKGVTESTGKFISFAGGRMSFAGADIPDDEIRCVIVGWVNHNTYYDPDVRYDPKNPQTPICYSSGVEADEMEPHADSPQPQHSDCASCPFNEFGSADSGRGKACKNTVRLALIAEDDLEDLDKAEVVYASIPPKSLKNWFKYITKDLRDKHQRPHWSVITLLSRVPDDESQFRVTFECVDLIEDSDLFSPLKELWQETMQGIDFPYVVRDNPKPAPKAKAKAKQKPKKFARK